MKNTFYSPVLILMSLIIGVIYFSNQPIIQSDEKYPADWFFMQRAFPSGEIPIEKYYEAVQQAQQMRRMNRSASINSWILRGPTNIGGRISDIEMSPTSFDTIYAGVASGGVFKSVDGGINWLPIFDETGVMSIGDIAVDPVNPNIVYVGTGEVNGGGGSVTYGGFGVYKSIDGGQNWIHLGLEATEFISRIIIDPVNPQNIYLGAMGKLFGKNPDRGLYKSTDGGIAWTNKLFLTDSTGCIDVALHPLDPNIIYAAMWERIRRPDRRSYGGSTCGIYRSTDGGENWIELTNGIPNNSSTVGRIGITTTPITPNSIYAIYADNIGNFAGVYKSTNNGDSWIRTNDAVLSGFYSSYGWWFGNIRANPGIPHNIFVLGLDVYKTQDDGQTWVYASSGMHVDQHGMYIHPLNPNFIVAGNDGGVYKSTDNGNSWTKISTMPITQFYTCEVDYQFPERLYGGTQDNGTNRTMTGNLNDWEEIYGGDGFYVLVDPVNNNFVYAEYQYGGFARSTNGGTDFVYGLNGVNSSDRFNWSSPFIIDPSNPMRLYFGSNRIYRSENRAQLWTQISPDLTNGPPSGNQVYGTITTIAASPSDSNVVYAGTDDGNVWVTLNGGITWTKISTSLPTRWVTRVAVDPDDAMTAYVTLSGYRYDEYLPHVFRTTDAGTNFQDISSNLPDAPVNDIIVDPEIEGRLYVATDVGVFYSDSLGNSWEYLGDILPNSPVTDLVLHNPTRTLIAATYGRSMYSINVSQTPEITVVYPNGGEHFMMGDTITITWTSNEIDSVKIELSLFDSLFWTPITESAPSTGSYEWIIQALTTSWDCRIKISSTNDSTVYDISDETFVIDIFPSVDDSVYTISPIEFSLSQNYPNPFNPTTNIEFRIADFGFVSLKIYDVLGNEIATLVNEEKPSGEYEVEFDGTGLPSGIYFYQLKAGNYIETKKMLLMK